VLPPVNQGNTAMPAKPTLFDTAHYFQQQANRARNANRKAHYQHWADHYRAEAKKAKPVSQLTRPALAQIR
jgi:hypothetical protein